MMNLLSLVVLCLLSSTAGALQCQTCTDANCLSTTLATCNTETSCITATAQVTQFNGASQTRTNQTYKACAAPQLCQSMGNQIYAIDESIEDVLISSRCCNTDNCNSETLAVPVKNTTENGRECHFCFRKICDIIIRCKGNEDRCYEARVASGNNTSTVGGCVSQNVCDLAPGLWSTPIVRTIANFTAVPTCCSGNLCNDLTAATASASNATVATSGASNASTAASGASNASTAASGASNASTAASGAPGEVTIHSHFLRLSMTQVFFGLFSVILW
ncbi:phospholipase A2 inhibitor and Ly6/PLAUR domain-containing protein-like [Gouania willdenowi]|uniref:phospholipase A2 inhibitor and Ly6/PLAUR domain-containing protein-like n=1 Tax=Gouania willdenowi TaxID=441366 RepID=UPI0010558EB1|nr:phospholipase A2 inhibitor and Ly6/PLAUR domain-containing protein-like [Gouania willdenowi]